MYSCLLMLLALQVGNSDLRKSAVGSSLVSGKQLVFEGSFDVPEIGSWQDAPNQRLDYSSGVMAYREDQNALYVATHAQNSTAVGLIKVPENLSPQESVLATSLAKPQHLPAIPDKNVQLRGLYWDQPTETLYYNYTVWYNVSGENAAGLGAVRRGKSFGLWFVAHNNASAGYITRDPQSGRLLTGSAIAQGIATSSLGPSVFRLELDEVNLPEPSQRIAFQTLMFFPFDSKRAAQRATLSNGQPWLDGMEVSGAVCIDGSLVVAIDEGERAFYGEAADFKSSFGFEPRSNSKGFHNDNYQAMLWLYSLADLNNSTPPAVRNKAPANQPNQPSPYEYVRVHELPTGGRLGGLAYDALRRRLFVSQSLANAAKTPRIFVYKLQQR